MTLRTVVLAASVLLAQQTPVFKTGVNLVALDVTVVDKDGKPIEGLKAADFVAPVSVDETLRARIAQGGVAFGVPVALRPFYAGIRPEPVDFSWA